MKNIEYNTYNTLKFQDYALSFQIFILLDWLILIDLFVHLNFNEVLEDGVQALVPVKWHDQKNFNGPLCHFKLKSKCSSGMLKHLGCTNTDTVNKNSNFYIHASHNKLIHFSLYAKNVDLSVIIFYLNTIWL